MIKAVAWAMFGLAFAGVAQAQIKPPKDPYFMGEGSWGQSYRDQWYLSAVGIDGGRKSAWSQVKKKPSDVIVAVIDTGLDWNHQDIDWDSLWRNPGEIQGNGKDDDGNGFVDDVIGWDFFAKNPKPWDHDGHGTFVTGIIAGTHGNKAGIAGINPHAKIMTLKAINNFGHSRASYLARALVYAADNGARIVNMSVGGEVLTDIERDAVNYAVSKGVFIVVASGNEGINVDEYGIAAHPDVLTVASTDLKGKRTIFSNWGRSVDIAAPGIDILSLRARRTDTMRDIPGVDYDAGMAYVGEDKRYYRASGTSFSAPIVAGVASLLLSNNPNLTPRDLKRILTNSAKDIGTKGIDQYSGYGLIDAKAALEADASYFIDANIERVALTNADGSQALQVLGTALANKFKSGVLELGAGEDPQSFRQVATLKKAIEEGALAVIPAQAFRGSAVWTLQLTVTHRDGSQRQARYRLNLG